MTPFCQILSYKTAKKSGTKLGDSLISKILQLHLLHGVNGDVGVHVRNLVVEEHKLEFELVVDHALINVREIIEKKGTVRLQETVD